MANRGEAADYYNGAPARDNYHQMQEPQYGQYNQQPPQYGQNYAPPQAPPPNGVQIGQPNYGEKQSFEQTFAIQKPKYNDWWAGVLVRITLVFLCNPADWHSSLLSS